MVSEEGHRLRTVPCNVQLLNETWLWVFEGALALYCLWAGLLILQNPGLQYERSAAST